MKIEEMCLIERGKLQAFEELLVVCKDILEHGYHRSRLMAAVALVEAD